MLHVSQLGFAHRICTQAPDPSAELCPCLAPQAYVWGLRAWECNSEFTDVCSRNYRHKIYESDILILGFTHSLTEWILSDFIHCLGVCF